MLKKFCIFLSLLLAILTANNANANMFNKFKKGFYFEKYSTAEEAKAELLKLHPVGSDAKVLLERIEGVGGVVEEESLESYKKFKQYDKWWEEGTDKLYFVKYDKASPFFVVLNWIEWSGGIRVDSNNKIISYGFHRGRAY